MDVVGVMVGAWVGIFPGSVGVAEGGTSGVELACACTVSATEVAITDSLSEGPQAPSRMLVTISRWNQGKGGFHFFLSINSCRELPA